MRLFRVRGERTEQAPFYVLPAGGALSPKARGPRRVTAVVTGRTALPDDCSRKQSSFSDDDGLKMAKPDMSAFGMLRCQSSSASLRVTESAAFRSRPNRPFWAPFSAQGSIPTATRGCTVHMVPRACAKAAVPGETAGGWPETGEVSMISSSPPAHASTRETHLRRCSSHPLLRL